MLMRHARNMRRVRYGKALLRVFLNKPSVALKFIIRAVERASDNPSLSTDISILRDDTTCRLITAPEEVITKLAQLETVAQSPDPSLPPVAPFPWIGHIHPAPTDSAPMIVGCITPAIMQEALRRTPSHKAAGPNGVPGIILKHMPMRSTRHCTSRSNQWTTTARSHWPMPCTKYGPHA